MEKFDALYAKITEEISETDHKAKEYDQIMSNYKKKLCLVSPYFSNDFIQRMIEREKAREKAKEEERRKQERLKAQEPIYEGEDLDHRGVLSYDYFDGYGDSARNDFIMELGWKPDNEKLKTVTVSCGFRKENGKLRNIRVYSSGHQILKKSPINFYSSLGI